MRIFEYSPIRSEWWCVMGVVFFVERLLVLGVGAKINGLLWDVWGGTSAV